MGRIELQESDLTKCGETIIRFLKESSPRWNVLDEFLKQFQKKDQNYLRQSYRNIDLEYLIGEDAVSYGMIAPSPSWEGILPCFTDLSSEDQNKLVDHIVTRIVEPEINHILVELPNVDISPSNSLKISDSFELVKATEQLMGEYYLPEHILEEELCDELSKKGVIDSPEVEEGYREEEDIRIDYFEPNYGTTYLRAKKRGFMSGCIRTLAFDQVINEFEALLGLCLIYRIMESSPSKASFPVGQPFMLSSSRPIVSGVFRKTETPYEGHPFSIISSHRFPESFGNLIACLGISDFAKAPTDDLQGRRLGSKTEFVADKLNRFVAPILDSEDEDAIRIRAASVWYLESLTSSNETFSMIQATIGTEALLGDSESQQRVMERLSDRAGYLLGRSQRERERIRQKFKDLYIVRSRLVHNYRPALAEQESQSLHKMQGMLSRLIQKEVEHFSLSCRPKP